MKLTLLSLIIISNLFATGQEKLFICTGQDDVVYSQWENIISINFLENSGQSLFLKTDNGHIKKRNECEFIWNPNKNGEGRIDIYKISGKDTNLIGGKVYLVKDMSFTFDIWLSKNGTLNYDSLLVRNGPIISRQYFGSIFEVKPRISEYSVLAMRKDNQLFNIKNLGHEFTSELKNNFEELTDSDLLVFYNIKFITAGLSNGKCEPVEFIIE